jgi:hypothetical protein
MTRSRPRDPSSPADAVALAGTGDARAENSRGQCAVARSGVAVDAALIRPELQLPRRVTAIVSRPVSTMDDPVRWRRYVEWRRKISDRERRRRVSVVYFIRGDQALKIGTASNIVKRFEGIQARSPVKLEIVGLIHGGVNVECWCHFHCIDHRSHYEWFHWNTRTKAFVRWVLAHGDDAAAKLCERHVLADGLLRKKRPAFTGTLGPLPHMRFRNDAGYLEDYKRFTAIRATPLGACSCELCLLQPWETWQ